MEALYKMQEVSGALGEYFVYFWPLHFKNNVEKEDTEVSDKNAVGVGIKTAWGKLKELDMFRKGEGKGD